MISSNVTEELETHNDETLFIREEVSLGFINIDNDSSCRENLVPGNV